MKPVHFQTADEFRDWLKKNHARATELWVAFYKKGSGKPGMSYLEAVDEALCFGWIDGIRKSFDADSYMNRFTPRRSGSTWSAINARRATELIEEGRMRPAGAKAFAARDSAKTDRQSSDRANPQLDAARERAFKANQRAWEFFQAQPPGYRRLALWWIVSAKREETRTQRFDRLLAESAAGRRIPMGP